MDDSTRQIMECTIDGSVFILPSPITCFARSLYSQAQTFHLSKTSNLILLDWYTSGRVGRGEEWQFERYRSENRVYFEGKNVLKDILLLEDDREDEDKRGGGKTSYYERVAPYSCYATLVLFGPRFKPLQDHLQKSFESISQYQQQRPYSLLWSYSQLENGGGIARCAGDSTEAVKDWILESLVEGGVDTMLGDLWSNVCS